MSDERESVKKPPCTHEPDPATIEYTRYGRKAKCKKCGCVLTLTRPIELSRNYVRLKSGEIRRVTLKGHIRERDRRRLIAMEKERGEEEKKKDAGKESGKLTPEQLDQCVNILEEGYEKAKKKKGEEG